MKVIALIERNDNNFYCITTRDAVSGCYFGGYGSSVAEAKADFQDSIREQLEIAAEDGRNVPDASELDVEYHYDIPSFFNDFDWINVSAFAKLAGVNESKMRAYKTGVATASERTINKIMGAVNTIAATLSTASLR